MSLIRTTLVSAVLVAGSALAAPSDGFITAKTKLALWTTANVRSTSVHVDTVDGVVTLYGKLPTAAQRTLAAKTASDIVGVKRVQDLIQIVPKGEEVATSTSDADLRKAAEQRFSKSPEFKSSTIKVKSVDKGVVMLSGEAKTYGEHLRAISLIDRLPGVKRIVSEVKTPKDFREDERVIFLTERKPMGVDRPVEGSSGNWDGRITMAVKLRLLTAADVPSNEISVDVEDGVVTLFGMVPTAAVKAEVGSQVSRVSGVMRVDNDLEVVSSLARMSVDAKDDDITKDLALALKPYDELKSVTTSVKNGVVQVSGKVPNGWERLHVLRVARGVTGVRTVEDLLSVNEPERAN
jgi:hyperosmotically inducible periplasmic protein